jgi:hypothetical protein
LFKEHLELLLNRKALLNKLRVLVEGFGVFQELEYIGGVDATMFLFEGCESSDGL